MDCSSSRRLASQLPSVQGGAVQLADLRHIKAHTNASHSLI
jgi:hypothetical protein